MHKICSQVKVLAKQVQANFFSNIEYPYEQFLKDFQNKSFKNVVVITGFGASQSSGIPDIYSSAGIKNFITDQLFQDQLTLYDFNCYLIDQMPIFNIMKKVFEKTYYPSLPYKFIKYLQDQNMLLVNFSENIDDLETEAGINPSKLVQVKGSIKTCTCVSCYKQYDAQYYLRQIDLDNSTKYPKCKNCFCLLKPDILFHRETVPFRYKLKKYNMWIADLVIVIGTQLETYPLSTILFQARRKTPIVVFNDKDSFLNLNNPLLKLKGGIVNNISKVASDLNIRID